MKDLRVGSVVSITIFFTFLMLFGAAGTVNEVALLRSTSFTEAEVIDETVRSGVASGEATV